MSSSSRCCATGVFVLPSLLLLPLLLSLICAAQGATLREHRLSGTEPVSYGSGPPPSAEMLRALRYIQSLSQRTPPDPVPDEDQSEDMESVRSMLQMAAPSRREEKDNTQELLQAVLTTLQQTEEHMKAPQKVIATPRYAVHQYPRPKQVQVGTGAENYGRSSWANSDNRRQHRQFPLMFEEDDDDQEQPLKRTNENAEEQYTPQKLATLQSVFEELSGIASSKANSKREDDDGKNDDLYRQRKMVLEDIMGTDDWAPLEEQMESEEEERERHGFTDDDDDVKRAVQSDWFQPGKEEEPEDIAKLVDYYLLQILEKKEQEQQKRSEEEKKDVEEDEDEEEDLEEREVKPMQSLSDVLRISQKLRIPPEELLELLQNEKRKDLFDRKPYGSPHKTPHQRPLETSNIAQDVLSILELVNAVQQNEKRPTQAKASRYYQRQTSRDDYDETAGEEDELANYLASEMQRHTRDEDQPVYANLQDYYEKRPGLDNSTMMKILRYLDPESDDVDETDSDGKTVPEM